MLEELGEACKVSVPNGTTLEQQACDQAWTWRREIDEACPKDCNPEGEVNLCALGQRTYGVSCTDLAHQAGCKTAFAAVDDAAIALVRDRCADVYPYSEQLDSVVLQLFTIADQCKATSNLKKNIKGNL